MHWCQQESSEYILSIRYLFTYAAIKAMAEHKYSVNVTMVILAAYVLYRYNQLLKRAASNTRGRFWH